MGGLLSARIRLLASRFKLSRLMSSDGVNEQYDVAGESVAVAADIKRLADCPNRVAQGF
jgi:hypothetical protein